MQISFSKSDISYMWTCLLHLVSTNIQRVPSIYVEVAWSLAGFQTSPFINPSVLCTLARCLMIFIQVAKGWTHRVYTKATLLKLQHRGMNPFSSLPSKLVTAQQKLAFMLSRLVIFYVQLRVKTNCNQSGCTLFMPKHKIFKTPMAYLYSFAVEQYKDWLQ